MLEQYTPADAIALHALKNQVRDCTRAVDAMSKVYPHSLEAAQVKHEVSILLSELQIHGLLPAQVQVAPHGSSEHIPDLATLREQIEQETPWLKVLDTTGGSVQVKDTSNLGILVAFSRPDDLCAYLHLIGRGEHA